MVNSKLFHQSQMDDIFQSSFCEGDEDFYNAPASLPNDDIWKKFELLPTPPLSPRRDNIPSDLNLDLEESVYLDIADLLREHEGNSLINLKTFPETPPSPNLQSKLIQDCMWSGSARTDSVEKKQGDKSQTSGYELNTCVDPASVFPYPIHSLSGYVSETKVHNLGTETPSDSEEEIDVVNIETQKHQLQPAAPRKQTTVTVRTFRADDIKKEPSDILQKTVTLRVKVDSPPDVHNYSLPHSHSLKRVRLPLSPANSPQPVKKLKRELSVPELKRVCQKLQAGSSSGRSSTCSSAASSRNSSDSEESYEGKRTQHNVLERKRRNDLKYSFFTLRDIVPDLTKQERAPKVLILKRASEYIKTLVDDEHRLESEKSDLTIRHEQLKRTLSKLQSKHFY